MKTEYAGGFLEKGGGFPLSVDRGLKTRNTGTSMQKGWIQIWIWELFSPEGDLAGAADARVPGAGGDTDETRTGSRAEVASLLDDKRARSRRKEERNA